MLRVAIVAPEGLPIPPVQGGSVQIYLHELTKELHQLSDIQTILISPGTETSPSGRIHISGRKRLYLKEVLQHLRRLQPDIVQIDNRPAWIPAVKRAVPTSRIVLNMHSTTFLGRSHLSPKRARTVLKRADVVVLNSRYLRTQISRKFHLQSSDWNPVVVHPGVSLDHFRRPSQTRDENRLLHVLFVGRVIRQKGVHKLVEAIRILRERGVPVKLTIIGNTHPWERTYSAAIRKWIESLPYVRWVGFVAPSKLPPYLWRSDILVCPSQHNEAFGLVNVEAMAAGLAVVASRQGGIREIVNHASGRLVSRYRDPRAFADAIEKLAKDRVLLARLQQGAQKRAALFTWNRVARAFANIYRGQIHRL